MLRRNSCKLVVAALILFAAHGCGRSDPAARPVDAAVPVGVPDAAVRVASYNVLRCHRGHDGVSANLAAMRADVVLLQEARRADADRLAADLGLPHVAYATRIERDYRGEAWGCAILSRHPLTHAAEVPRRPGGQFVGVWAWCVVGDRKFRVACVHLTATNRPFDLRHTKQTFVDRANEIASLAEAWQREGSPPMLAGGDFNTTPVEPNYAAIRGVGADALATLGRAGPTLDAGPVPLRVDYLLHTPGWRPAEGGVGPAGASDHRPIWVALESAGR